MKYRFIILFFGAFLNHFELLSQYYPKEVFQSPMDTPLYLSAPFGSLRDNHFHSGMDIRTYEKEGLPVYAIADGYVSRIKVSPVGYGKALYIHHYNGYTSVYGHLQKYADAIGAYVKSYQYEHETFDFDHYLSSETLPVKKGQIIGWSGNSGGSTGPHLHFEIRDSRSEEPINPQLFGIPGIDIYQPVIKKVLLYNLDQNRPVLLNDFFVTSQKLHQIDSVFIFKDTIEVLKGKLGIAIEAYDYLTNTENEYSIYCAETYLDKKQIFGFRLDRFKFDDSRYINAHIDYEIYKRDRVRFQKCFLDDGNKIPIYHFMRNKGKILLADDSIHQVSISVYDFDGRSYMLSFYIKGFDGRLKNDNNENCKIQIAYPSRSNFFKTKNASIEIQPQALYDTTQLCIEELPREKGFLSPVIKVHQPYTPLHKNMSLSIKCDTTIRKYADKLLLASLQKDKITRSAGGDYANGWVTLRTSTFGNYAITLDTIAPVAKLINISKEGVVKDTAAMYIRYTDDFSGLASYQAAINGKWALLEYDAKNDLLIYYFDENTPFNKKIEWQLTLSDKKGNKLTLKKDVIFKKE
jgi:hypothetical protein